MELSGECRLGMTPGRNPVLEVLADALVVAKQADPFPLFAEQAGFFHGQPSLSTSRAAGEPDPWQRPRGLQKHRLPLGEMILDVFQLSRVQQLGAIVSQCSVKHADDAFHERRRQRRSAAAFPLDGGPDQLGR